MMLSRAAEIVAIIVLLSLLDRYYDDMMISHQCQNLNKNTDKQTTRVMIISDTHIMGPIKSNRIDKFVREWEMHQIFKSLVRRLTPDVIIFLGDLLDEGSFSSDEAFEKAVNDFEQIFDCDECNRIPRFMIAGNHDIGFHDHMTRFPWLLSRFYQSFKSGVGLEVKKFNDLNFVIINSMTFYNDSCPYCKGSLMLLDQASINLKGESILLSHIPLYRPDDLSCEASWSHMDRTQEKNIEGKDVIHRDQTRLLLHKLKPRLILSGHTHMHCTTEHNLPDIDAKFKELTVSSFNYKYAIYKPSFILLSANASTIHEYHCYLPNELARLISYAATIVMICLIRIFLRLNEIAWVRLS